MIEVTGTLKAEDYVRSTYLHMRPGKIYRIVGYLLLPVFAWAIWLALTDGRLDRGDFVMVGGPLVLVAIFWFYMPRKARKMYHQHKELQSEIVYRFDDDAVRVKTVNGNATFPWSDYLKWKSNDQLLLLYISDGLYQMVPRHFFEDPGEFDRLRNMIDTKMGPEKV